MGKSEGGLCFRGFGISVAGDGEVGVEGLTHSDQGEDVVHVGADVNLHKAHNHSHLLEEELGNKRETEMFQNFKKQEVVVVYVKEKKKENRCAGWLYLPDAGVTNPDHVEERGHNLGQELDTLEA